MERLKLVREEAKLYAKIIMLKDIKFDFFTKDQFIDFLMSLPNTKRRVQVIEGIVTKNMGMGPKLVCPIPKDERLSKPLTNMINRIITKEYLLIHEVYVDRDCFTVNVPEDKFENFFKVMTSYRQD